MLYTVKVIDFGKIRTITESLRLDGVYTRSYNKFLQPSVTGKCIFLNDSRSLINILRGIRK